VRVAPHCLASIDAATASSAAMVPVFKPHARVGLRWRRAEPAMLYPPVPLMTAGARGAVFADSTCVSLCARNQKFTSALLSQVRMAVALPHGDASG